MPQDDIEYLTKQVQLYKHLRDRSFDDINFAVCAGTYLTSRIDSDAACSFRPYNLTWRMVTALREDMLGMSSAILYDYDGCASTDGTAGNKDSLRILVDEARHDMIRAALLIPSANYLSKAAGLDATYPQLDPDKPVRIISTFMLQSKYLPYVMVPIVPDIYGSDQEKIDDLTDLAFDNFAQDQRWKIFRTFKEWCENSGDESELDDIKLWKLIEITEKQDGGCRHADDWVFQACAEEDFKVAVGILRMIEKVYPDIAPGGKDDTVPGICAVIDKIYEMLGQRSANKAIDPYFEGGNTDGTNGTGGDADSDSSTNDNVDGNAVKGGGGN